MKLEHLINIKKNNSMDGTAYFAVQRQKNFLKIIPKGTRTSRGSQIKVSEGNSILIVYKGTADGLQKSALYSGYTSLNKSFVSNPGGYKSSGILLKSLPQPSTFYNFTFDKGRLKSLVSWSLKTYGEYKTIQLLENLKKTGFEYATKAGISLGVEDLKIPPKKAILLAEGEAIAKKAMDQYNRSEITGVEKFQRLIDTWHRTSEQLKQEVIDYFEITDVLNPVYMMAFSGARGNISQVRQLVGMRGLMADPKGQIIDYPIRSNFREGLTVTEYIISSYGARKGIVDTALRTANAGYLTRRLVDVAQHVVISNFDCGTSKGIFLTDMKEGNKTIYSLQTRLIGRVLARDLFHTPESAAISNSALTNGSAITESQKSLLASRNQEITADLAFEITKFYKKVFVRSSLTCSGSSPANGGVNTKLICQLCYGWSLAQGNLVSIGEAVGIVAAQSIGEPGTQLTMRTFHTGGVFSGDTSDQIRSPYNGFVSYNSAYGPEKIAGTLIRTPEGKMAFLTKTDGFVSVIRKIETVSTRESNLNLAYGLVGETPETKKWKIPAYTILYYQNNQEVNEKQVIAQISTIARQQNMRDDSELTVKSEIQGEFLIKNLQIEKQFIGPKLKKPEKAALIQNQLSHGPKTAKPINAFPYGVMEPKLTSWDWGYAWVLSCKQYKVPIFKAENNNKISFVPRFGDFVNNRSIMNQIQWYTPDNGGYAVYFQKDSSKAVSLAQTTFQNSGGALENPLSITGLENQKQERIKKFSIAGANMPYNNFFIQEGSSSQGGRKPQNNNNYSPNLFNIYNYGSSYQKTSQISTNLKKDRNIFNNINIAKNLLFFDIQKLFFKKIGYFLDLQTPQTEDALSIKNLIKQNNSLDTVQPYQKSVTVKPYQKNFIFLQNNLKGLTNPNNYNTKSNFYSIQLFTLTESSTSNVDPESTAVESKNKNRVSTWPNTGKFPGGVNKQKISAEPKQVGRRPTKKKPSHKILSRELKTNSSILTRKSKIGQKSKLFSNIGFWTLKNVYKFGAAETRAFSFGNKNNLKFKASGAEILFGLDSSQRSYKPAKGLEGIKSQVKKSSAFWALEQNRFKKSPNIQNLEKLSPEVKSTRKNFVIGMPSFYSRTQNAFSFLKYSKFSGSNVSMPTITSSLSGGAETIGGAIRKGPQGKKTLPMYPTNFFGYNKIRQIKDSKTILKDVFPGTVNNYSAASRVNKKTAYFLYLKKPYGQRPFKATNNSSNYKTKTLNVGFTNSTPMGLSVTQKIRNFEKLISAQSHQKTSDSSALKAASPHMHNKFLNIEFCNSNSKSIMAPPGHRKRSIPEKFYILNKCLCSKASTKGIIALSKEPFYTKTNKVLRLFSLSLKKNIKTIKMLPAKDFNFTEAKKIKGLYEPNIKNFRNNAPMVADQKKVPLLLSFSLNPNNLALNFNKNINLGTTVEPGPTVRVSTNSKNSNRLKPVVGRDNEISSFAVSGWVYKTFNLKAGLKLDKTIISSYKNIFAIGADNKHNVNVVAPSVMAFKSAVGRFKSHCLNFDNQTNINLISFCLVPKAMQSYLAGGEGVLTGDAIKASPQGKTDKKENKNNFLEKQKNIKWYVNPKPRFLPLEMKPRQKQEDSPEIFKEKNFNLLSKLVPESASAYQKNQPYAGSDVNQIGAETLYVLFKPAFSVGMNGSGNLKSDLNGKIKKDNYIKIKNQEVYINNKNKLNLSSKNLFKSRFSHFGKLALLKDIAPQGLYAKEQAETRQKTKNNIKKSFKILLSKNYKKYSNSSIITSTGKIIRPKAEKVINKSLVNSKNLVQQKLLCPKKSKAFLIFAGGHKKNYIPLEAISKIKKTSKLFYSSELANRALKSAYGRENIFITRNSFSSGKLFGSFVDNLSSNKAPMGSKLIFNLKDYFSVGARTQTGYKKQEKSLKGPLFNRSNRLFALNLNNKSLYTKQSLSGHLYKMHFQNKQKISLNPISKMPNARILVAKQIPSSPGELYKKSQDRNSNTSCGASFKKLNFVSSYVRIEKNILTLTMPCLFTDKYKYKFKNLNVNLTYMLNSNALFQSGPEASIGFAAFGANKTNGMLNVLSSLTFNNNIWKYSNLECSRKKEGFFADRPLEPYRLKLLSTTKPQVSSLQPKTLLADSQVAKNRFNTAYRTGGSIKSLLLSLFKQVCFEMNMNMKLKNYKFGYIFKTYSKNKAQGSRKSYNNQPVLTNSSFTTGAESISSLVTTYGLDSCNWDGSAGGTSKSGVLGSNKWFKPSSYLNKSEFMDSTNIYSASYKNNYSLQKINTKRFTTAFKICFDNLNNTLNSLASTSFLSSYTGEIISNASKTGNQSSVTGRNIETRNLKAKELALTLDTAKGRKKQLIQIPKRPLSLNRSENLKTDNFTTLKGGACLVLTQKDILSFKTIKKDSEINKILKLFVGHEIYSPEKAIGALKQVSRKPEKLKNTFRSKNIGLKDSQYSGTKILNQIIAAPQGLLFNTKKENPKLLVKILSDLDRKNNSISQKSRDNNNNFDSTREANSGQKIGDFVLRGTIYKPYSELAFRPDLTSPGGFVNYTVEQETNLEQTNQSVFPLAGQIIHINQRKVTIRKAQPFFISAKTTFHAFHGDFVQSKEPVITLIYQKLKTGDIIQGIPKVEQFFEARTTKRGRLFRDNLPNLLKGLFLKYYFYCLKLIKQGWTNSSHLGLNTASDDVLGHRSSSSVGEDKNYTLGTLGGEKLKTSSTGQLDYAYVASQWAVKQSFYKIQQIAVDGVLRVYRSQGVTISDKHLEIIVKQMTTKVRIIQSGQTAFFPGEIVDLDFVQTLNAVLMRKIHYEPMILGITKASLQVDSFLSAASFQQTSKILSQAALVNKKDYLKGVKENVLLGNLIPAGTGYIIS